MFPTFHIPEKRYLQSLADSLSIISGMQFIHHPLNVGLYYDPEAVKFMGLINPDEYIKHQFERVEKAYGEKDVHTYVFTHARPYRFGALLDAQHWAELVQWYETAGECWVDSEGPGLNIATWRLAVFNTPHSSLTMNAGEFKLYKTFQTPYIDGAMVYRGADSSAHARNGLSWTLDEDKAKWFAQRYSRSRGYVASVKIRRVHIAAIFLRRGENEVILRRIPRGVQVRSL